MDVAAYERRTRTGPCFVCAHVAGEPGAGHASVYEDDRCVAFLGRYPTLRGYALVCPREHVVDVTGDRDLFLHVTGVAHDLAEALKRVLPVERVYLLSLGSHQGNAHVHWHVAPLPPGVPYAEQQYRALMAEHGILPFTAAEQADLATEIAATLSALRARP